MLGRLDERDMLKQAMNTGVSTPRGAASEAGHVLCRLPNDVAVILTKAQYDRVKQAHCPEPAGEASSSSSPRSPCGDSGSSASSPNSRKKRSADENGSPHHSSMKRSVRRAKAEATALRDFRRFVDALVYPVTARVDSHPIECTADLIGPEDGPHWRCPGSSSCTTLREVVSSLPLDDPLGETQDVFERVVLDHPDNKTRVTLAKLRRSLAAPRPTPPNAGHALVSALLEIGSLKDHSVLTSALVQYCASSNTSQEKVFDILMSAHGVVTGSVYDFAKSCAATSAVQPSDARNT